MNTELWIILIATLLLVVINFIADLSKAPKLKTGLNIIIIIGLLIYLLTKIL